jgi:tetrahydromethanopterin S-methyltransferase subunit G
LARKRRRRLPDGTDSFEEVDDEEDTDLDHRVESVETQLSEFFQKSLVSSQQLNAVKARLDKLARDIEEGAEV